MAGNRFLITGCSGGGKSCLLSELRMRGYTTVEEPGRRVIEEQLTQGGQALPWTDLASFAQHALTIAHADLIGVQDRPEPIFFDRGLVDAAVALGSQTDASVETLLSGYPRYDRRVFMAPPWPEIFRNDAERRHDFESAVNEFHRLEGQLPALGYQIVLLPKIGIKARADFVISHSLPESD